LGRPDISYQDIKKSLVGNIPAINVPNGMDVTEDQDIIVAKDGAVVFGVVYHSWAFTTNNEQVLLMGGGGYYGDQLLMTSYRS
jgi:hypothetical protein